MKRFLKLAGIIVVALMFLSCLGLAFPVEVVGLVLFGWIPFLLRTPPRMTVEPTAIAVAGVALLLLIAITHSLARWLFVHFQAGLALQRPWRLRWSAAIVGMVVLLFASGIRLIVTVHQVGWLATTKEPLIYAGGVRQAARRSASRNNLKQIGIAFFAHEQKRGKFPPGGTFSATGEVKEHFKPWGHSVNWRDPAEGINKSPDGFGAPWGGGAQFSFMDGSVRFISEGIDPAVLRALSAPAGGEKIPENWDER
jgi:hypothetical protein